jgi:hypothetical protein
MCVCVFGPDQGHIHGTGWLYGVQGPVGQTQDLMEWKQRKELKPAVVPGGSGQGREACQSQTDSEPGLAIQ